LAGGDCGLNKSRALRFSFGGNQVHVTIPARQIIYGAIIIGMMLVYGRARQTEGSAAERPSS
jgi:hypothetical protein